MNGIRANIMQDGKRLRAMGLGSKDVVVSDLVDLMPVQLWFID